MTRPVAYACHDLDREAWPGPCRNFSPSLAKTKKNREMTWEEYEAFQADCRSLASNEGEFRAAGCKRYAHRQLPQGRQGTRYGALTGPLRQGADGLTYEQRVASPRLTPALRRTQSPLAAPETRQGVFARRRVEEATAEATARAGEAQILAVLRREAGPDERLMLNRPKAAALLAQLGDLVQPERGEELLAALGTRTERFFGEQADAQGESNLPEIMRDLAFAAEVYQAEPLMRRADRNPLVLKTPSTGWYVAMGERDAYRLRRVLVGDAQIEVKPLVDQLQNQARRLAPPRTGRGLDTDEKGEARKLSQAQQLAFFRLLRRELERHEGNVTFVFAFEGQEVRVEVPRSTLQHSDVSASRSRKRRPDYTRLTFLTLPDLASFLAGTATSSQRRTLRGRRLPPVTTARNNPMARPKFVNFPDYTDLQPGEMRPIPSDPLYCVYRKSGRNVHLLPLEAQFEITTCSRAQSWQRLNQRALSSSDTPRPLRPALTQENPMARSRHNPPFDPLAALMAEYGPQARLGASQASLSPEFNETYKASGGYGPYGLSDAPYGGQAMLPVNRRNPNGGHAHARRNAGEPLDMNQKGLKWRDFVKAYGERRDTFVVPTPLASQKWAEYKRLHGIVTDPKVAERLRSLGKGKKARKNQGDMGETAPLSPWDHESEYELVRGAYGPGSEMPPVNRRNPNGGHAHARRNAGLRPSVLGGSARMQDLSSRDLRNMDLRGVDLEGADLSFTDLSGSDLQGANMRGVFGEGTKLRGANLSGADLMGSEWIGQVDFTGASLADANFTNANLHADVLFGGADLRRANFRNVDVDNIDFKDANTKGALFLRGRVMVPPLGRAQPRLSPGKQKRTLDRAHVKHAAVRRNPAPEFTRYEDLSDAQLTFLSNTGDESASQELALRNPRSRR